MISYEIKFVSNDSNVATYKYMFKIQVAEEIINRIRMSHDVWFPTMCILTSVDSDEPV